MKKVVPVILLVLVIGGICCLLTQEKLALLSSTERRKEGYSIILTVFHSECQHREVTEDNYQPQKWASLLEDFSQKGWMITSFATDHAELQKEAVGLCAQCQEKEFVGIYGNEIGVYAGSPETPGPLKQVIPVNIEQLPPAEIQDLRAGIICHEAQDKWKILEGYQN
jgi:hypothetical protein